MSRVLLVISCLFIFTSCGFARFAFIEMPSGEKVQVKMAVLNSEKVIGLSGLEKLTDFDGMLFVYEKPARASHWMRGMLFSLDMYFIDENKKVLEIRRDLSPCQSEEDCPAIISENENIRYVLELPIGVGDEYGLEINSIINW